MIIKQDKKHAHAQQKKTKRNLVILASSVQLSAVNPVDHLALANPMLTRRAMVHPAGSHRVGQSV